MSAVLRGVSGQIPTFDVSEFSAAEFGTALDDVREVQRRLDGLVVRMAQRAEQLAAVGAVGSPEEALRGDGQVLGRQARREAKRATAASSIAGLGEALSAGATTGDHVDSIVRHTSKLPEKQRASFGFADLVEQATQLPPDSFDRYAKRSVIAAMADHGLGDTKAKRSASEFRHWFDHESGMGRFSGALDPERYEILTAAIERRVSAMAAASTAKATKGPSLAATALLSLVGGHGAGDGRQTASVLVVVDHETMASGPHEASIMQTENGHDLPPESIARLCCDATLRRVTLDEVGVPLNVGRKYRTATDAQWAAMKTLRSSCAWEGCTAPIAWCQAHHIREWEHGGLTDLDNLIPLCSKHHHRVHEGRWSIKLLPDQTLRVHKPNGALYHTVPPPSRGSRRREVSAERQLADRRAGPQP